MRSALSCCLVSVVALTVKDGAWAQTPRLLAEVPRYPGAVVDTAEAADPSGPAQEARLTVEGAHVAMVMQFYKQRLRATQGAAYEFERLFAMRAGAVTPVGYELEFHEFKDQWCLDDPVSEAEGTAGCYDAAQADETGVDRSGPPDLHAKDKRAALSRARPPDQGGQWVERATFTWAAKRSDSALTRFELELRDDGLSDDWKQYQPRTVIHILTETQELECPSDLPELKAICDRQAAQRDAESDRRWAERSAAVAAQPPSERELGVPLYPGAPFDAINTAGMSSDEEAYYIYHSTDAVEKVVAFYQQRTGRKAEKLDDEGYMFVLRGQAPFPDLGVTIQPNTMFPPPAKTVITIRKSLR